MDADPPVTEDMFGDVLPERTRDDAATWDEHEDEQANDERLRRDVPPHY